MKYTVKKDCDWKDFSAKKGQTVTDPKADGKPLPADVVEVLVRLGCLVAVEE